jgi:hypothetical protein
LGEGECRIDDIEAVTSTRLACTTDTPAGALAKSKSKRKLKWVVGEDSDPDLHQILRKRNQLEISNIKRNKP